jgi:S1-C subfamily serine protease
VKQRDEAPAWLRATRLVVVALVFAWVVGVVAWVVRASILSEERRAQRTAATELRTGLASFAGLQTALNAAAEATEPSVVQVVVRRQPDVAASRGLPVTGRGSGTVVGVTETRGISEGELAYVLTNEHVVADAAEVEAILSDGRRVAVEVVAGDPLADLALLRVRAEGLLPCIWAEAEPRKGDVVLALGNPFGLGTNGGGASASLGVISAVDRRDTGPFRTFRPDGFRGFLQTDAAINPGNSGGPLVNLAGQVVGINTAVASERDDGAFAGVGFAIPAEFAQRVFVDLRDRGRVVRGWLGLRVANAEDGVAVLGVYSGSPADVSGLAAGDIVTHVAGGRVRDAEAYRRQVASLPPAAAVPVTIRRRGEVREVEMTAVERPTSLLDVTLSTPPDAFGLTLRDDADGSPVVAAISPNSPAKAAGVRVGDRVFSVGGVPVATRVEAEAALAEAGDEAAVELDVGGRVIRVTLRRP